jgi:hypothetical protein
VIGKQGNRERIIEVVNLMKVWQGGGRELMRDSATVKQKKTGFEECQVAPGVRPEQGHLALEVKMANGKLYPSPISVTCSKWYIRKAPLFLGFELLSAESLPACLINLLPKSFGALSL